MTSMRTVIGAMLAGVTLAAAAQRPAGIVIDAEPERPPPPLRCPMPRVGATDLIVRVGAREGGQISNLAIGGPDAPAYVITLRIEEGTRPLYVVATSRDAILWRITGDTKRVRALVTASPAFYPGTARPAIAETGLAAARFHIVPPACFGDFDETSMGDYFQRGPVGAAIRDRVGRSADRFLGGYQMQGVSLPSMTRFRMARALPPFPTGAPGSPAAGAWRTFTDYFGGLARIDPRRVVARTPIRSFETYPYHAGLAQLLGNGSIVPANPDGATGFRIVRPMRYPPALYGGFSQYFELVPGVPLPTGNPGHSKVFAMEPARCIVGCR